jgi:hypothetical protein
MYLAEWTGLEPATSCVTGRHSNQLNYHSVSSESLLPDGTANIVSFYIYTSAYFKKLIYAFCYTKTAILPQ